VAHDLKRGQGEMIERERLAHEIDLAREIQRSLLPATSYRGDELIVRGEQRPAAEVGGDSYDILPFPDGRVAVTVADVAGKGLAGCLVMAMCSVLLRTLRHVHRSPSALLAALDQSLGESLKPGVFVTLFYGVAEPSTGRLTWASAGHNPGLVYRRASGAVERCASRGVPLGATRGGVIRHTLEDQMLELAPGDLLVQYTDGFTEAFAPGSREPFGLERVEASVSRHAPDGADAVLEGLRADVERWTGLEMPEDDETLLVVARPLYAGRTSPPDQDPSRWLAAARDRGSRLELEPNLDTLRDKILGWLRGVSPAAALAPQELELLGTALYEVCANIAEHGLGQEPTQRFELWWAPGDSDDAREGRFVVRDDGEAFQPRERPWTNFQDPEVWRRGRGFGLEIIHRVMRDVVYQPQTEEGNVTLLRFGPRRDGPQSEGMR
jgi:anti-sigma regulatory factor (Ser/Thr protein kinase)